jgi:hypothetical protein
LKDKRPSEIAEVLERLSTQIEFATTTDSVLFSEFKKDSNFGRFFDVFEGIPTDLDDNLFPALKRFAQHAVPGLIMQGFGGLKFVEPSCGPTTILSILHYPFCEGLYRLQSRAPSPLNSLKGLH